MQANKHGRWNNCICNLTTNKLRIPICLIIIFKMRESVHHRLILMFVHAKCTNTNSMEKWNIIKRITNKTKREVVRKKEKKRKNMNIAIICCCRFNFGMKHTMRIFNTLEWFMHKNVKHRLREFLLQYRGDYDHAYELTRINSSMWCWNLYFTTQNVSLRIG